MKAKMVQYVRELQNEICSALEKVDGKGKFVEDAWERPGGGGGRSRILSNGDVIEKGGVNVSEVFGQLPKMMQDKLGVQDANFFATGISLVIHPHNPHCPTSHANWRYFEMYNAKGDVVDAWFGGGLDLTPYHLYADDAQHWHRTCFDACKPYGTELYTEYKKACDEYFWNTHRNEARGVGGLFFDYLKDETKGLSLEQWFSFVQNVGNHFLTAYVPILDRRIHTPYTEDEKYWQEIRRGRYVEFNLIHDRGTLFGLKTNGRTESILMSLPPLVRWDYNILPSNENQKTLVNVLKHPKDWFKYSNQT